MICKTILKNYDEKEILCIKSSRIYYLTFKRKILPQTKYSNGKELSGSMNPHCFLVDVCVVGGQDGFDLVKCMWFYID